MYPNPATNRISFDAGDNEIVMIRVYAVNGQLILTDDHPGNQLDISMLKAGIYVCQPVIRCFLCYERGKFINQVLSP